MFLVFKTHFIEIYLPFKNSKSLIKDFRQPWKDCLNKTSAKWRRHNSLLIFIAVLRDLIHSCSHSFPFWNSGNDCFLLTLTLFSCHASLQLPALLCLEKSGNPLFSRIQTRFSVHERRKKCRHRSRFRVSNARSVFVRLRTRWNQLFI